MPSSHTKGNLIRPGRAPGPWPAASDPTVTEALCPEPNFAESAAGARTGRPSPGRYGLSVGDFRGPSGSELQPQ
eukprot:761356-Hanusia_phi.AAC.3